MVSAREAEVLELVGRGQTNSEIGRNLFISVRTVESHVSALLRKLDLPDRRALAAHATIDHGEGRAASVLVGAPEALTTFVGRGADLAAVAAALQHNRLVTLTGPGGIGKTRLALEAGRRHSAPARWFVDLVPAEVMQVVPRVACVLGVSDRPNQSLEEVIHGEIGARASLLVFDNCEHVLDAIAAVTQRVLEACPDVTVLATSREALGVPGEYVLPVPPLPVAGEGDGDDAVALFEARAAASGATIIPGDRDAIVEICTQLDGMPLAIELAAARCATLGVDGVREALGDRLRLLSGARGADARHHSLRAILDWSYDLLDAEEQSVLRRASLFHGPFRVGDAVSIAGEGMERLAALDAIARLAAKSLLVRARSDERGSSYRMLETIRAYGHAKLDEAGETATTRDRHLDWAIDEAGSLEYALDSTGAMSERPDSIFDDLRAALEWAEGRGRRPDAHVLARRVGHLLYARRFVTEAQQRYEEAARFAADEGEASRDLLDAGHCACAAMRGDLGYQCFLEAARRAEAAGDTATAAMVLALATERANRMPAEFPEVPERAELDSMLERARALDDGSDARVRAQIAVAEAWSSATQRPSSTVPAAEHALLEARAVGDPILESSALDALAAAKWAEGHLAASAEICRDRVALLGRMPVNDPRSGVEQLDILHMVSDVQLSRGNLPQAKSFARDAARHPLALGATHVLHRELVVALCLTGEFDEALVEAAAMRSIWERSGQPAAGWMAPATYLVALIHGLRGERTEFDDWWALSERVCLTPDNAVYAFVAIRLALHEGRLEDAVDAIERRRQATSSVDSEFPWSTASLGYEGYLWAVAAEVWCEQGRPDAADRIESVRSSYAEHIWAHACLLRAEGRLRHDAALIERAAGEFAKIDARFEEAVTLVLLDDGRNERGRAMLRAMGCSVPRRAQPKASAPPANTRAGK